MQVAEIMIDRLYEQPTQEGDVNEWTSNVGKQFHYEAMLNWWGWNDIPDNSDWLPKEKTKFKLYDDDDELYYEGWLLNDDQCMVQDFVLSWAKADSGCTTITVYKDAEVGYVQEIG